LVIAQLVLIAHSLKLSAQKYFENAFGQNEFDVFGSYQQQLTDRPPTPATTTQISFVPSSN